MIYLFDILVFIFGSAIGSFLNVVILRLPEDKPLTGRSHCPHCGHQLTAPELIPLVSFLALGGRCRDCKTKISPRYFIIEAACGLLFLLGWLVLAPAAPASWVMFAEFLLLAAVGLAVFVIDLEHYFVIENLVLVTAGIILLVNLTTGHFLNSLLGALVGAAPIFLAWVFPPRGQWMGFGDVELMLMLGAAAGFPGVLVVLLLAIFGGGLVSLILLGFTSKNLKSRIPFGTLLVPAALAAMLWAPQIIHWYLGLLGI
jgi:leader peptidase (prepilin peptidase)/N-methyltransferase